jgi:hypothetical protein
MQGPSNKAEEHKRQKKAHGLFKRSDIISIAAYCGEKKGNKQQLLIM